MKRSEALEKLEALLQTIPVTDNGSYYQDAEVVLSYLESIGMRPPCKKLMGSTYVIDYSWEPEDEERP